MAPTPPASSRDPLASPCIPHGDDGRTHLRSIDKPVEAIAESCVPSTAFGGLMRSCVVVLPALDEEESVAASVRHWRSRGAAEVRVVDNGSIDRTSAAATEAGAVVLREGRRGYGAAAWAGTRRLPAGTEWLLFASADGSDHLDEDAAAAFAGAVADGARLVVGDRVSMAGSRRHLSPPQRFGNALCSLLIALGWRAPRARDIGSLRLVRRDFFESLALRDRGFGWNIEMHVAAIEAGHPPVEVPVGYRPRLAGNAKISGSLVGVLRAGRDILWTLAKLRFRRRRLAGCGGSPIA